MEGPNRSFEEKIGRLKGLRLNIVGKVVLINSVLNVIPIYNLSFYKAPIKVLNDICSIQSNFL